MEVGCCLLAAVAAGINDFSQFWVDFDFTQPCENLIRGFPQGW
jgi:hypothetical protein